MAVTIIRSAFLGVAQDAIGFGGFLELFLGFVIAGIAVGMEFEAPAGAKTFLGPRSSQSRLTARTSCNSRA